MNFKRNLLRRPLVVKEAKLAFLSFLSCCFFLSALLAQVAPASELSPVAPAIDSSAQNQQALPPNPNFLSPSGAAFTVSNFLTNTLFFLEDLPILQQTTDRQGRKTLNFNYEDFVKNLVLATNALIIKTLTAQLNPAASNKPLPEQREELLLNTGWIAAELEVISNFQVLTNSEAKVITNISFTTNRAGRSYVPPGLVSSVALFPPAKSVGVVLQRADLLDIYTVTVGETSERTVSLLGNVEIKFEDDFIAADKIVINTVTKDVLAEGNVVLRPGTDTIYGSKLLINFDTRQGFLFDAAGLREGDYFKGKLIRINSKDYYTVEEAWVTFSSNEQPHYTVRASVFDTYGKDKAIFTDAFIYVHNNPFLWLPYFIRYPLSTGIALRFGETRREGYYLIMDLLLDFPWIGKIPLQFDVYEKLGLYLGLANKNTLGASDYSFSLGLAYYTENQNVIQKPAKLTYSHHTGDYLNSESFFRYKVAFSQKFKLVNATNKIVSSSFGFSLNKVSDPFITHNFNRNLARLDLRKMIERHDRDEELYKPSISDKDKYEVDYTLSAPQTSLSAKLKWLYEVYDDPNKNDLNVDERYTMYLKTVTLPSLSLRHSGTLDPYANATDRLFYVNLGYSTSLSYSAEQTYKDGTAQGTGTGIEKNIAPYGFLKDQHKLNLGLSLSRPFTIDVDKNSIVDFGLNWFTWTVTPSFAIAYGRGWRVKDYTSSDNLRADRSDFTLTYGLSSSQGFGTLLASPLDSALSLSWNLKDSRTKYLFPTDRLIGSVYQEELRNLSTALSLSLNFNFPSSKLKAVWEKSYGIESMFPTFVWKNSYSQSQFTSKPFIEKGKVLEFDRYSARSLSSSLSGVHKGYGFLYLPSLNYTLSSSVSLTYDLMPETDAQGNYKSLNFFTEPAYWREERIKSFAGDTSWNWQYKIISFNNRFSYYFFDTTTKKIAPAGTKYTMGWVLNYAKPTPKTSYFNFDNFKFSFDWNYYLREKDYSSDSMSFKFSTVVDVIRLFKMSFTFSAANPSSELYFQKKRSYLGVNENYNFFEDVFNSLGLLGVAKQRKALFKLGGFDFSIYHTLGDWFTRFSYSFVPVSFSKGSMKGFYFDQKIQFQVNLLPGKDPRGPQEAAVDPFFEPLDNNLAPQQLIDIKKN